MKRRTRTVEGYRLPTLHDIPRRNSEPGHRKREAAHIRHRMVGAQSRKEYQRIRNGAAR